MLLSKEFTIEGRGIDLSFEGSVGYTMFKVTMLVTRCLLLVFNQKPVTSNE